MTRVIIWCCSFIGAGALGFLGYAFATWWVTNPSMAFVIPMVVVGSLAGLVVGYMIGFVVAGLVEQ